MENNSTKKKLVTAAYEIIRDEGLEAATARKIAAQAGCTATLIYKYFGSLDYLITMACFPFLDDYNEKISHVATMNESAIIRNRIGWGIFVRCAFEYPEIYERTFWGPGKPLYEDAISEYYELFPENLKLKKTAYYLVTTFSSDLVDRDLIWLRRAAAEHSIDIEDIFYISKVNSYIVHGMLRDYLRNEYKLEDAVETAIKLVDKTTDTFVELKKLRDSSRR